MKICKDCRIEKNSLEFYGVQGECKSCTKKRVKLNYFKNHAYYAQYEKERQKNPNRRLKKIEYQRTLRKKSPEKYKARNIVSSKIRAGTLKREKCVICGNIKSQAHHTDYLKPLEIIWLCRKHHMEIEGKMPF